MMLAIRLLADVLHTAMMLYICVKIFSVSIDQNKRNWMIVGTVIIFLVMTYKSYIQLDYLLLGRTLEMLLLLLMALIVSKLIDRAFDESLALSFIVMIIAVPVYFAVTMIWMNISNLSITFRDLEMITSIGLLLYYGSLILILSGRFGKIINGILKKLVINFKYQFIVTFIFMNLSLIGSEIINHHDNSIGNYMVMLSLSFGVLLLLTIFVLINKQRKVQDLLEKQFKMLEYQSMTIEELLNNTEAENSDKEYFNSIIKELKKLRNPVIQGVLLTEVQVAKQMGVTVDLMIETSLLGIELEDLLLSRIISILVDNAIESNSKIITLKLIQEDYKKIFSVENSYKTLVIENDVWISTKGRNRGNGLKMLQTILDIHPTISEITEVSETLIVKKLIFKEDVS